MSPASFCLKLLLYFEEFETFIIVLIHLLCHSNLQQGFHNCAIAQLTCTGNSKVSWNKLSRGAERWRDTICFEILTPSEPLRWKSLVALVEVLIWDNLLSYFAFHSPTKKNRLKSNCHSLLLSVFEKNMTLLMTCGRVNGDEGWGRWTKAPGDSQRPLLLLHCRPRNNV